MKKSFNMILSAVLILLLTAQVNAYTFNKRTFKNVGLLNTVEFELPDLFDEKIKRENVKPLAGIVVGEGGFESGKGTESEPYIIKTAAQLKYFAKSVNTDKNTYDGLYVKLNNDISLNEIGEYESWEDTPPAYEWTPIGSLTTIFKGTFDGAGYAVSGIYINNAAAGVYLGFFGVAQNAVIKNLKLNELYIRGSKIGGFVGYYVANENKTIENCILGKNSTITGVENSNDQVYFIGGIAGCVSAMGGITLTVKNCANICENKTELGIKGLSMTGGIIGFTNNPAIKGGSNYNTHIIISDCYNSSPVTGYQYTGGIVGNNMAEVTNCLNIGEINKNASSDDYLILQSGAIIGSGLQSANCYYLSTCGAAGSGVALTAEQLQSPKISYLLNTDGIDTTKTNHASWALTNELCIIDNHLTANTTNSGSYPYTLPDVAWYTDAAKVNGAYVIDSYADLLGLSRLVYGGTDDFAGDTVKLTGNITVTTADYYFEPIGTPGNPFAGIFDGGGYTVSGLKIDTNVDCQGFFGSNTGTVDNLRIANVSFKQPGCTVDENGIAIPEGMASQMGGIAGDNSGTISRCSVAGSISGLEFIGGIAGDNSGIITDCLNTATVEADSNNAGGIAGSSNTAYTLDAETCVIKNCVNTGTVSKGGIPEISSGEKLNYGGIIGNNTGNYNCYYKSGCGYSETENNCIASGSGNALDTTSLSSATAAYLLNTNGGVTSNSEIWTAGTANPVFAASPSVATTAPGGTYGGVIPDTSWHNGGGTYILTDFADLLAFTRLVNNGVDSFAGRTVFLGGDITMDYTCLDTWEPIGNPAHPFNGSFDGQGQTVSNIAVDANVNYQGFFGYVSGAGVSIKNLNAAVDHIYLYAPFAASVTPPTLFVGGIAGYMGGTGAVIENCRTLNYSNTAHITAHTNMNYTGGIVGEFNGADISGCYNEVKISGMDIGGIAGSCKGNISGCRNNGKIFNNTVFGATTHAGGIVGITYDTENTRSTIDNCVNNASVSACYSGGIVGYNNVNIKNCFNNGEINPGFDSTGVIGGIAGLNQYVIADCINGGEISNGKNSQTSMTGGITGNNSLAISSISGCMNYGAVTAYYYCGGIAGSNVGSITKCSNGGGVSATATGGSLGGICADNSKTVSDCYNIGTLKGYYNIGGICGKQSAGSTDNCYSIGIITKSGTSTKLVNMIIGNNLIIGNNSPGTVTNCYYLSTSAPDEEEAYGTSLTDSKMQSDASFTGFDFTDTWTMGGYGAYKYPELKSLDHSIYTYRQYDVNNDGYKDIADVRYLYNYIKNGGEYVINYEFNAIMNNQQPTGSLDMDDVKALLYLILRMDQSLT